MDTNGLVALMVMATRLPHLVQASQVSELLPEINLGVSPLNDLMFETQNHTRQLGIDASIAASGIGDTELACNYAKHALTRHKNPVRLQRASVCLGGLYATQHSNES